ncbi:MAG: RluA family pseudouridine synthase [Candidatus Harrisonbacteria bacterium CG10_big_fil_rev_8_21_14_0_10_40_38]|uniref:Pseudouridine synthase n=1 Tax=Candidatus Harrisonbacteria bacterium CG10_big_fil_rev_8_21_14_0_10_40_38 TaxID=1974583 RepID=A0A2H0US16_9BACT|nr:MAG: RluA family pseudouridine synthase [Candidatus Harrisonbacteria bacterium CG10_big_fil_rev_8_21_14_0_10_40_38]
MNIEVIYEDDDILVINKPAGLLVHRAKIRSKKNVHEDKTVTDWVLEHYPEISSVGDDPNTRPGIVHRLDRDTSGVLVIAKTNESFLYLKSLFQSGEIKKEYLALVRGVPNQESGVIDFPIGLKSGTTKWGVRGKNLKMLKPAETHYSVKKVFDTDFGKFALLSVSPKTGRTHQIRVHLSAISHPVVCDSLYGGKKYLDEVKNFGLGRQFLHALSIELVLPSGSRTMFSAELSDDLSRVLDSLQS